MPRDLYYFAVSDLDCIISCGHEHSTIISAVQCISCAGGYVIAVENGELRALTEAEDETFHYALYGTGMESAKESDCESILLKLRLQWRLQ